MILYQAEQSNVLVLLPSGLLYLTRAQVSTMEPLMGPCQSHLEDQSMLFPSSLNVRYLHTHRRPSMEPRATHRFLLLAVPEAGDCKIYLAREQSF